MCNLPVLSIQKLSNSFSFRIIKFKISAFLAIKHFEM